MAKGYWIATYRSIKNPAALAEYGKVAAPILEAAGGRFIVRGIPVKAVELGMLERVVIIEFDSIEKAIAAYESPQYQQALVLLGDGAERDIRFSAGY